MCFVNAKNTRLVYASDGSHNNLCRFCQTNPCRCRRDVTVEPAKTCIKIRLEKNGRGGKSVTVLFNLPESEEYFSRLLKQLKAHCGTGGTYKDSQIELQGDHREKSKTFLEKMGFHVKLAGG